MNWNSFILGAVAACFITFFITMSLAFAGMLLERRRDKKKLKAVPRRRAA